MIEGQPYEPSKMTTYAIICRNCGAHETIIDESGLRANYQKLLEFAKSIHGCPYGQSCHEQALEAIELLKEIGELND